MSLIGKYLLQSLLRSTAGKAFQQAPEGSALNLMGTQMEKYNPVNMLYETAKQIPMLGEGIASLKNTLMPEAYGTSQKEFNRYQGIVDSSSGAGTFGDLISGIYGEGGIMQGYNPVSAFGRGPVGAIENRITSIMNRSAPQTDYSRNLINQLQAAKNKLTFGSFYGQGDGITSYDTPNVTSTGVNLDALYDDLGQSGGGSDSSGSSGGSSFGGGFSTSSSGTEETF